MLNIFLALFIATLISAIEFLHIVSLPVLVISFIAAFILLFIFLQIFGWRKLLYIFVVFFIACILLEVVLRSLDHNGLLTLTAKQNTLGQIVCYPSNPRGYFNIDLRDPKERKKYGVKGDIWKETPFCIENKVSSLGYRERELEFQSDKPKVVFLGDSFTAGMGVKEEDRFTNLLAKEYWLNKLEVYNLGLNGAEVKGIYEIPFVDALIMSPDIIVYCFSLNDPILGNKLSGKQKYINDLMNIRYYHSDLFNFFNLMIAHYRHSPYLKNFFEKEKELVLNSRLLFIGRHIFFDRLITNQTIEWYKLIYSQDNTGWQTTKQIILNMKEKCRKSNTFFALVVLPIFYDFSNYPFVDIHQEIVKFCQENHIPVLDTLDCFLSTNYKDYIVHPLDYHPNSAAHEKIAEKINLFLEKKITEILKERERYYEPKF